MTTQSYLINETTQYQGTTSQIVKDIFKVIKQNITEEEQKTYYLPEELDLDKMFYDASYGSGVSVELTIKRDTEMTEPFLVDAMYVPEEEILEITIQLNPFEEPKSYAPLYQYLIEYVRHELEHFDQEYKGTLPDAEEGLSTMEYYSQPHEVQAQSAGLNLKAKKTRQGYEKVVGDSIELTKQRYGLSDEEGNDLYNLIVGDIEERYGKKELNKERRFPGTFLTEQDESFTPRGHTIFDDDEYKVWAALDKKSFCEFAKGTKWCVEKSHMWDRLGYSKGGGGGTYYFVKDKKTGDLNLVSDYSRIPLLRDGDIRQVFNEDGIPMDKFKFFSQKTELRKLFDIKYTLPQRIRLDMPFTPEEQDKWYKENITPLSTVVYALAQGKEVEKNMALLEDLVGPDLTVIDGYRYRSPIRGDDYGQIEIMKDGILVYLEEDKYTQDILCIHEDDIYYYNRAYDSYGDDYEEMDSDELNYMACWFSGEVMQRVYGLMEKLDADFDKAACSDFDDGEFTEFFEGHFPRLWDVVTDELLNHLGYGIGESRRVEMREFLEAEIIIPFTSEGSGEVSIFIPYVQLLFHVTNHNMKTLSPLLSDETCIGEVDGGLSDIWYDAWDWPQHTHEEMDYTMNDFLDKIDEADVSVADRKAGVDKYKKTMKDLNFKPINSWGTQYEFKQPWEGGNTIKVRHYNVEDDTVDLYINTPEMIYRNIPVPGIPLDELVKFTQPTLFDDVWKEIGKGYN